MYDFLSRKERKQNRIIKALFDMRQIASLITGWEKKSSKRTDREKFVKSILRWVVVLSLIKYSEISQSKIELFPNLPCKSYLVTLVNPQQ